MLGLRRELADRHVFDHAPPQWAHGLVGHGDAPVLSEGCEPLISRQDVPLRYRVGCVASRSKLPRERFSPLATNRTWPDVRFESASLIGHLGSSTFRLPTTATVSTSLAGSCFSSESAPGPFHHGIRRRAEL